MRSESGFASIETALSLLTSVSVLVFFLSFIYTAIAKVWLQHITYEAVVCRAEDQQRARCELNLKRRASWIQAELATSNWKKSTLHWSLRAEWKLMKNIELKTQSQIWQRSFR